MTHIDDWIDDASNDAYARKWFELFRRPAMDKARAPNPALLFATYEGKRWRVMGCSRLGDVWLNVPEHAGEFGYEKRVDVADCSEWSAIVKAEEKP